MKGLSSDMPLTTGARLSIFVFLFSTADAALPLSLQTVSISGRSLPRR